MRWHRSGQSCIRPSMVFPPGKSARLSRGLGEVYASGSGDAKRWRAALWSQSCADVRAVKLLLSAFLLISFYAPVGAQAVPLPRARPAEAPSAQGAEPQIATEPAASAAGNA